MKPIRTAAISLIAVLSTAAVAQTGAPAAAPKSMWTSGFGQGITEYSTGTFDRPVDGGLRISCLPDGGASLSAQIKGIEPAAGSRILLAPTTRAGRSQNFAFTVGADQDVNFARVRGDRQFARLWAALRGGNNVTVRFADGSFSVQSLVGAGRTLPTRPCG